MTSLLLIVSFLLHAILLIAIYQLYQQLQQIKQTNENELHQMIQQFIAEIKEENKHLQAQLTAQSAPPNVHEHHQVKDESIVTSYSKAAPTLPTQKAKPMNHVDSIIELTDKKCEQTEVSFEGKVLQMYHQGFDVDQIAKQLESGRTEVDLIIKLQSY